MELDKLFELLGRTLERVEKLEEIFNDLLCKVDSARCEYETDERRTAFVDKHGGKFAEFADKLKAIEGDDFDIVRKAFSDYDALEDKPDEDEYVAALIAKISAQLKKIAEAYGVSEVAAESTDTDGDGIPDDTTVEAEGEPVAEAVEEGAQPESQEGEQPVNEEGGEPESAEEEIDSPEEIAEFVKELEEELSRMR